MTKAKVAALSCLFDVRTGIGFIKVYKQGDHTAPMYSGKSSTPFKQQVEEVYTLLVGDEDPHEIIAKHADAAIDALPPAALVEPDEDEEVDLSDLSKVDGDVTFEEE